jgi:hypothetical protein
MRAALLGAAAAVWGAMPAFAQTCGAPDLLAALPPDGATGVPIGAPLHALYAAAAIYQSEPVLLDLPDGTQRALVGEFDPAEGQLTLLPPDALVALTAYTVHWPELRGTTSGGKGRGRSVTFTTGEGPDTTPPSFAGATALAWDWARESDDCTDNIEDRLAFSLSLADASDDGGRESLTLLLSQTQGPLLGPSPRQVFLGALPPPGQPARLSMAVDSAVGRICFAALVRDLTGKISNGGNTEVCVRTTRPPFFNGCALVPPGRSTGGAFGMAAVLGLVLLAWRRRNHAR